MWCDWRSSRCRLSSLTERRAVARIHSSHSEVLRAVSFRERKEREDGSFQVSLSTGVATKILRSKKVPSFSHSTLSLLLIHRTHILSHIHIHIQPRHAHETRHVYTHTHIYIHIHVYTCNRLSFSR